MIDLSKWDEYTKEQKKIPWIIFIFIGWGIGILSWVIEVFNR